MWDQTNNDALDPDELADALDFLGGKVVDVVAYDACEAQVIEVETLWRGHTDYLVGAQDDVWYDGFRQNVVLTALKANPNLTAEQVAVTMAQTLTDRTSSVVTVNGALDNLLTAVTAWSTELKAGLPLYKPYYDAAYDQTQGMPGDVLNKDLYDMAYEIWLSVPDDAVAIKATSQAVMDAFTTGLVPFEYHHSSKYKTAHGIGIWWPRYPANLNYPYYASVQNDFVYYQTLDFAAQTGWDQFLAAYVGVDWPYVP